MRKIPALLILLLTSISTVYAQPDDKQTSYEEIYTEWGYTNLNKAIAVFENHFDKELELPLRVPPLSFTHQFGKFNDSEGDINDTLELQFTSEIHPENHYKINVKPHKNRITINERQLVNTYKLEDESTASYIRIGPSKKAHFYALLFQRNGWQYILSVDKRVTDTVTPEVLVKIANSF